MDASATKPAPASASTANRAEALVRAALRNIGIPVVAIAIFLGLWSLAARNIKVSFGSLPGPAAVVTEVGNLWKEHQSENARERAFYERQAERKAKFLAGNPAGEWKERKYAGHPTFFKQIITSLETVFTGFLIASLIAVPLGIVCGLSRNLNLAFNPFIQLFKPVSPLAWLPIVMILVSALYNPPDPLFEKAFLSSALTVALCSLWDPLESTCRHASLSIL